MRLSLLLFYLLFVVTLFGQENNNPFMVKPYLQVGYHPSASTLELIWQSESEKDNLTVEIKNSGEKEWIKMMPSQSRKIVLAGMQNSFIFRTLLSGLKPGTIFQYRILKGEQIVFAAEAKSSKTSDQGFRFVVFGDIGAATREAKKMANQAYLAKPDLIVVPGDIVYEYGLISEYKTKFWPVYNADKADSSGAPLMRSIPFIAAPGNHDADTRDLNVHPDALAYYLYWHQPLNGLLTKEGSSLVPMLKASDDARKSFTDAAGEAYPRMTNFSYNYGNVHWTILDADTYVDWTDSSLQKWVAEDLSLAQTMTWRFVVFHHPGFNSSREHFEQQQMRLLSPVFEKGKVDIVFNGHVHNYQRSYPLHFIPDGNGILLSVSKNAKPRGRMVTGRWTLDKIFNGTKNSKPSGVIYIVTGAGGQELYNPEQNNDSDSWQKFTYRFVSNIHSMTVADVSGKKVTVRQIGEDGKELDKFIITR